MNNIYFFKLKKKKREENEKNEIVNISFFNF